MNVRKMVGQFGYCLKKGDFSSIIVVASENYRRNED